MGKTHKNSVRYTNMFIIGASEEKEAAAICKQILDKIYPLIKHMKFKKVHEIQANYDQTTFYS